MRGSTTAKSHVAVEVSPQLGAAIRRRRVAMGMTQTELGSPFTRSFISAVELGHCMPSLAALVTIATRLETTPGELLAAVSSGGLARVARRRRNEQKPRDTSSAR